jgi:hypothetical protein
MADPLMLLSWGACCGRILTVSEFPIARSEVRGLASLSANDQFLAYPEDAFLETADARAGRLEEDLGEAISLKENRPAVNRWSATINVRGHIA